jgi:SAM-dependent methyltransferase
VTDASRHDAWSAGDAYEQYMGRWSRGIARQFLDWMSPSDGLTWVDVGCGTGALSASILERCGPGSLIGIEPSPAFLALARNRIADGRARFEQGDAQALPIGDRTQDVVVSGLVLNFVPDRNLALAEMKRVVRPGGTVAFYVWDYPGGGLEFLRAFWTAASELDPKAADLSEDQRFPFCQGQPLCDIAEASGLMDVAFDAIEAPTIFRDFEDFWRPFTLGAGPAPGYCSSLSERDREALRERLDASLPRSGDGSIMLKARAWAVRGRVSEGA